MTNRRRFLEALAAAGAVSLAPSSAIFGQERAVKLNVRGGAIDVHHHFVPPGGTTPAAFRTTDRCRNWYGSAWRNWPHFGRSS